MQERGLGVAGGWGAGKGAGVYFTALFGTDCCWVVAGGAAAHLHRLHSLLDTPGLSSNIYRGEADTSITQNSFPRRR